MLNDVLFNNDKSAYIDWHMVLTNVEIPLPIAKTSTIDIQGADGVIDLSEALTGDVVYDNRVAKLTFELFDLSSYYELISEISNYLHGKVVTFILTRDDSYYYTGRASINSWECSKNKGRIVITVDCDPYKYELNETRFMISVSDETKTISLPNLRKKVCPSLDVDGNITLTIDGHEYMLTSGTHQLLNLTLLEGFNKVKISGNGTITICYRRGSL
jgi:phage-related protein